MDDKYVIKLESDSGKVGYWGKRGFTESKRSAMVFASHDSAISSYLEIEEKHSQYITPNWFIRIVIK